MHALTRVGQILPPVAHRALNRAINQLDTGRRMRAHGMSIPPPVSAKFDVFAPALDRFGRATQPLYIEFGVYRGSSILEWARRIANPGARFVGFDSFQGLPEDWTDRYRAGHFSTGGEPPSTADGRVSFVKGWFDVTVPGYQPPAHDLLVICIDGDLYSSAVPCLRWAADHLRIRDYIYFDEFQDREHEGRAFDEFMAQTGFRFEAVAATYGLEKILLRRSE